MLVSAHKYLGNVRNGIEQFYQFAKSIVGNTTLAAKVMVVRWYKPAEWQATLRTMLQ